MSERGDVAMTQQEGRVFVVQRPAYLDRTTRQWVDKYDLSAAEEYGELVFLLRPGNIYRDQLRAAQQDLREALSDFGPGDHVMAVGDPVAIAMAVVIASRSSGGVVSVLKFDRMTGRYGAYPVDPQ